MVVISIFSGVVLAADVDDGVAGREDSGVACSDEGGGGVGGELAEEVDGESFIGVEVAAGKLLILFLACTVRAGCTYGCLLEDRRTF